MLKSSLHPLVTDTGEGVRPIRMAPREPGSQLCHHVLGLHMHFNGDFTDLDKVKMPIRRRNFVADPVSAADLCRLSRLDESVPQATMSLQIFSYIPRDQVVSLS